MLNPVLFKLLEKRFGEGEVRIVHDDEPMVCSYAIDPACRADDVRYKLEIDSSGEEYAVRCPFCKDWNHRLYINHHWGVFDNKTNSRNLWLAHCWNEECLAVYSNQLELYNQVVEYCQIGPRLEPRVVETRTSDTVAKRKPKPLALPGPVITLDVMKEKTPRHRALQYVEDRLWDPVKLGKLHRVSYCVDAYYSMAADRLIAPVFLHGKQIGWQARYLGDPPKGVAKWWTCPGMPIGSCLYNYDNMTKCQTKVIVEGPADVWSFGPQAAALFTKTMSKEQRRLLVDCVRPEDTVVILLDPAQDDKSKARGELHHIEKLYNQLQKEPKLSGKVLKVYLPDGCDPDELDRSYMRRLIKYHANKQGLHVSFGKPKVAVHD